MKKRRVRFCLCILLCVAACFFVLQYLVISLNQMRMLKAVSLQDMRGLKQISYTYWKDILKYGDGYEIMTFLADGAQWNPPDHWMVATAHKNIEELATELEADINTDALLKQDSGRITCESWFFVDNRNNRPFDEQDFYFAYCDETNNGDRLITIYRGHHLYGI
ncbi:MAG: hypothetical protein IKU34_08595 [Clostridia bacterium]|nr:hypothetical protein [Clostridia bacterium]